MYWLTLRGDVGTSRRGDVATLERRDVADPFMHSLHMLQKLLPTAALFVPMYLHPHQTLIQESSHKNYEITVNKRENGKTDAGVI